MSAGEAWEVQTVKAEAFDAASMQVPGMSEGQDGAPGNGPTLRARRSCPVAERRPVRQAAPGCRHVRLDAFRPHVMSDRVFCDELRVSWPA